MKNSTDSLTSHLKKLNEVKSDLSKKDDEINALKREIGRKKSGSVGGSDTSKKELESLRDEVTRLKKQLKEKAGIILFKNLVTETDKVAQTNRVQTFHQLLCIGYFHQNWGWGYSIGVSIKICVKYNKNKNRTHN